MTHMRYVVDNITAHVAPGGLSLTNATTLAEVSKPYPTRITPSSPLFTFFLLFTFCLFIYFLFLKDSEALFRVVPKVQPPRRVHHSPPPSPCPLYLSPKK